MVIQALLSVWILSLIYLVNRFRREGKLRQQRIMSFFLVLWAGLGVAYYDVWAVHSGLLEESGDHWYTYLPVVFFSICAGMGIYYLLVTFGKFRVMDQQNQARADQIEAAKRKEKERKKAGGKNTAKGSKNSSDSPKKKPKKK